MEGQGIVSDIAWLTRPLVEAGAMVPVVEGRTMPQAICHLDTCRDICRWARTSALVEAVRRWWEREATG